MKNEVTGVPKTWDEVRVFDDLVPEEIRGIIKGLCPGHDVNCPYLCKEGQFWTYCNSPHSGVARVTEGTPRKPSPSSPIYQRHVGTAELQLWCMSDHEGCIAKKDIFGLYRK